MGVNKSAIILFVLLVSSMAATWATSRETGENSEGLATAASVDAPTTLESEESSLLRRLLKRQSNPRAATTCDKYPLVCHMKGSPGHHCCRKRCVDLKADNLNCGQCGKKCKHGEICCHSECVNIMYDRKNCGGCHRKCKKGSYCRYGMCSYA